MLFRSVSQSRYERWIRLADFVTTGKMNLSDFVNWAAKELAKIGMRELGASILGASGSSGGIPFISGIKALFMHSGGVVGGAGNATRMAHPAMFVGAPRFHNGLMPDEFPAILQKGEAVIPKNQTAALFGGGGVSIPISVVVNVDDGLS